MSIGVGAEGLAEALLSIVDDVDALYVELDTLQRRLGDIYSEGKGLEGYRYMDEMLKLFDSEAVDISDLTNKTALYLCGPCFICGTLSSRCMTASQRIVAIMCAEGPPREVFTGLMDGASRLLETANGEDINRIFPTLLQSVVTTISRIERRKERFASISLHLVYKTIKKICEDYIYGTLSAGSLPSFISLVDFCKGMFGKAVQIELSTFAVLSTGNILSVILWASTVTDSPEQKLQEEVEENLSPLFVNLRLPVSHSGETTQLLATAWSEEIGESENEDDVKAAINRAFGMMSWATTRLESIPRLSDLEMDTCVLYLIDAALPITETPYILAGIQLLPLVLGNGRQKSECFWKGVCLQLVDLMDSHPHMAIKTSTCTAVGDIIKQIADPLKWSLLNVLVFVKCSDIAALMVQHLKSVVVSCRDTNADDSVYLSPKLYDLLLQLLREENTDEELIERADLYVAVFNLFRFLIVRDTKKERMSLREGMSDVHCSIHRRAESIRAQTIRSLSKNEQELRLERLKHVVDTVVEHLSNAGYNLPWSRSCIV